MKLPNAPLVEVVFEMRWALQGSGDVPVQLRSDPVYSLLASEFAENAKKHGFSYQKQKDISPVGVLGHIVDRRFYRDESAPFPIWQIGPGIFACNESTDYEWDNFEKLIESGLITLLQSYPRSKTYPIQPVHLELRYTDVFSEDVIGHSDLARFLSDDININLTLNDFARSDRFIGQFDGKFEITRRTKKDPDSQFSVQISTGFARNVRAIIHVNRVVKSLPRLNLGKTNKKIVSSAIEWASNAHALTHEFFFDLVPEELMEKFK